MNRRHFLSHAACALAVCQALVASRAVRAAQADDFPSRPMTIVVPASPGGAIDLLARLIGQKMTEQWGKGVAVDNRAGATGIIGTDLVAKAPADGHMLALVASSHAINPSMVARLPFDTLASFEPVALTHVVPLMLVVSPTLPVNSLQELIAYGKANPGRLLFASSGQGGAPHFSGELFKAMAGIDIGHVPYKGSTPAHPDLASGRTSLMFDTVTAIAPQIRSNRVRALAVTTSQRIEMFPELPTMAEAGLPGYETSTWGGLLAPARTPAPVVARLNAEVNRILQLSDVRKTLAESGIEPGGGTPARFREFIASEIGKWAEVAKAAGIRPE